MILTVDIPEFSNVQAIPIPPAAQASWVPVRSGPMLVFGLQHLRSKANLRVPSSPLCSWLYNSHTVSRRRIHCCMWNSTKPNSTAQLTRHQSSHFHGTAPQYLSGTHSLVSYRRGRCRTLQRYVLHKMASNTMWPTGHEPLIKTYQETSVSCNALNE